MGRLRRSLSCPQLIARKHNADDQRGQTAVPSSTCDNGFRFLGDQGTSENFPLSVHLLFHGIERHSEIAVRTDQQDRLGRLTVDDMQLGKPSHAPRTVYWLVKGLHDSHKILRAAILRLNLWTG